MRHNASYASGQHIHLQVHYATLCISTPETEKKNRRRKQTSNTTTRPVRPLPPKILRQPGPYHTARTPSRDTRRQDENRPRSFPKPLDANERRMVLARDLPAPHSREKLARGLLRLHVARFNKPVAITTPHMPTTISNVHDKRSGKSRIPWRNSSPTKAQPPNTVQFPS